LAGTLASTYIKGLQENGVGATVKHFAANEQETRRFTMNVNVSERALRYCNQVLYF
jgi:beta-glucosidase